MEQINKSRQMVVSFFKHCTSIFRRVSSSETTPRPLLRTSSTRLFCLKSCKSRTLVEVVGPSTLTWWIRTRQSSTLPGLKRPHRTSSSNSITPEEWRDPLSDPRQKRRKNRTPCLPCNKYYIHAVRYIYYFSGPHSWGVKRSVKTCEKRKFSCF